MPRQPDVAEEIASGLLTPKHKPLPLATDYATPRLQKFLTKEKRIKPTPNERNLTQSTPDDF